jgi:hypothetical protein
LTGASVIWPEFLRGDQRYYFVPCPHCDEYQKLVWEQVRWDKGDEFVAAPAGHQAGGGYCRAEAGGDLLQQGIADDMAVAVVHGLEADEIDEDERPGAVHVAPGVGQRAAVGEAGEDVVPRLEFEACEALALADDHHQKDEDQRAE